MAAAAAIVTATAAAMAAPAAAASTASAMTASASPLRCGRRGDDQGYGESDGARDLRETALHRDSPRQGLGPIEIYSMRRAAPS
jgi:hypothetical protein